MKVWSTFACRALSANGGMVKRNFGLQSSSCLRSSSPVYIGFAVVTTPPRSEMAWKRMAKSGQLQAKIAATSPFLKPRFANDPASLSTASIHPA
jgi:hypothetical protein